MMKNAFRLKIGLVFLNYDLNRSNNPLGNLLYISKLYIKCWSFFNAFRDGTSWQEDATWGGY